MKGKEFMKEAYTEIVEMLRQENIRSKQAAKAAAENQVLEAAHREYLTVVAVVYDVLKQNLNLLELTLPGTDYQIASNRGVFVNNGRIYYVVQVRKNRNHKMARREFGDTLQGLLDRYCYYNGYKHLVLSRIIVQGNDTLELLFRVENWNS